MFLAKHLQYKDKVTGRQPYMFKYIYPPSKVCIKFYLFISNIENAANLLDTKASFVVQGRYVGFQLI